MRNWSELSGAPNLKPNVLKDGSDLLCSELHRHREARRFTGVPKKLLLSPFVYLHDDAVDEIILRLALLSVPLTPELNDFGNIIGVERVLVYRKSELREVRKLFTLRCGHHCPFKLIDVIQERTKRTTRRNGRVELTHRTSSNVTRIRKERLTFFLSTLIEL